MPCTPLDFHRSALHEAALQLDAAEVGGQPHAMAHALLQLARAYRSMGALDAAEAGLNGALRWSRLTGSVDATVDLLCESSETAATRAEQLDDGERRSGRGHLARERAREAAFEAARSAAHVADSRWEITVLLRISDVLDRCGDRDDAVGLQTRALRLMAGEAGAAPDPQHVPGVRDA
jgi:tetratricopeptide (TPR) repeat protein